MNVTVYHRPDGRKEVIRVHNVHPEDAQWFEEHGVAVSMEDIGGMFAVYGDIGRELDGEPDEIIVLSQGMNCEGTLAKLRKECEEALV